MNCTERGGNVPDSLLKSITISRFSSSCLHIFATFQFSPESVPFQTFWYGKAVWLGIHRSVTNSSSLNLSYYFFKLEAVIRQIQDAIDLPFLS